MSAALIWTGRQNLADSAGITSNFAMASGRPLSELTRPFLAGLARTNDTFTPGLDSWVLTVDLGDTYTLDFIGVYGINGAGAYVCSVSGGAASADGTTISETVTYSSGSADVATLGSNILIPLAAASAATRHLEIDMRWSTAAGVAYYDARRLVICPALRLSRAASIESTFEVVDRDSVTRSRGERVFATPRKPHKLHSIALRGLTQEQAIGTEAAAATNLQKYLADIGQAGELGIYPTLADQHRIHRLGAYGHLEGAARIRPQGRGYYASDLVVRQAPA